MTAIPQNHRFNRRQTAPRLVGTVRETASRLGITELTVRRHIKAGKLNAVQIGGSWRIPINQDRIHELPIECTLHQVANSLDVSDLTVRRWIKNGQFPATKRDRTWVVRRDDLEQLLLKTSTGTVGSQIDQLGDAR